MTWTFAMVCLGALVVGSLVRQLEELVPQARWERQAHGRIGPWIAAGSLLLIIAATLLR